MAEKSNYAIESTVKLYGVLCETIETTSKESNKDNNSKLSIYDYVNNYLLYSAPFLLLKEELGDKDQLAHDCYLLSKGIIESSDISPLYRTKLYEPLRQSDIYMFSSKLFKKGHLTGYSLLINFSLSIIDDLNEDTQAMIEIKDVCRPLVIFLITGFPLKTNGKNKLEDNIKILSSYISFQLMILIDIYFTIRLAREGISQKSPTDYISGLNKIVLEFFVKNEYPEEAIEYSSKLLKRLYSISLENLDKIYKVEEIYNSLKYQQPAIKNKFKIDKPQTLNQLAKAKGKPGEKKNDKPRPTRKKASTTVSRKQPGKSKPRTKS
jgi:hypothetical protein